MHEMENHRGCVSPPAPQVEGGLGCCIGFLLLAILAMLPLFSTGHPSHAVPLKTREELRKDLDHIFIPAIPPRIPAPKPTPNPKDTLP